MNILLFIMTSITIIMLLHLMITNLLFGIDLKKCKSEYSKHYLINSVICFVVIIAIIIIAILTKDTECINILNYIDGFVISWIISNYYIKYL